MVVPARHRLQPPRQGMSLIEVLVAILVVSAGILALLGLMATSSRLSKTSELRSLATLLAADMADRLRANAAGAKAGEYSLRPSALATGRGAPAAQPCTSVCTAAQMAAWDVALWRAAVFNSLPAGTAFLSYDGGTDTADLWLMWRDPSASDADNALIQTGAELAQSCPPGFALTPRPVCMYFRVAR
ncbi:MAG: type IV pilus modification protein PilV [Ideonella sp. MAG2]|nr:MAG: type IV pilus modification protein PilV [Ideonella sp. MAG2]